MKILQVTAQETKTQVPGGNIYIYIQIYVRATPGLGRHSQSNVVATLHSIGKINKGVREY